MYTLSERRAIETVEVNGEVAVVISDLNSDNFIEIPAARWASFLLLQGDINETIKQLKNKHYFKYFQHFGGGWYVSMMRGFIDIDIRRFYFTNDCEIKATKHGITLRVSEWTALQKLLPLLMSFTPELLTAYPCFLREDHKEPHILSDCRECTPFGDFIAWHFLYILECAFRRREARKSVGITSDLSGQQSKI